jgi:hypothetical protein
VTDWTIRYTMGPFLVMRVMLVGLVGLMAVLGLAGLIAGLLSPSPAVWFVVPWLAIVSWNGYWLCFRVVLRLSATPDELFWEAPLRSGSLPVSSLRVIRPSRLGGNMQVFQTDSGQMLRVWVQKGLREFCGVLQEWNPGLQARFSWQLRLLELWPTLFTSPHFEARLANPDAVHRE